MNCDICSDIEIEGLKESLSREYLGRFLVFILIGRITPPIYQRTSEEMDGALHKITCDENT